MNIEVRPASAADRDVLVRMFLNLLKFLDQFENDVLPTEGNAELMVDTVFLPAAERGEPVLIAWEGDKPVGAIFWILQQLPYRSRWKTAYGWGTYLEEGYREKKIGTMLRDRAKKILKSKGVQKLMGMVILKNKASVKASDSYGFVPFARIDYLDID